MGTLQFQFGWLAIEQAEWKKQSRRAQRGFAKLALGLTGLLCITVQIAAGLDPALLEFVLTGLCSSLQGRCRVLWQGASSAINSKFKMWGPDYMHNM